MITKLDTYNSNFRASDLRNYFSNFHEIYVDPILDYESIKDAKNKKVFPWQQEAIDKLVGKYFGMGIAPCGAGKTALMVALICEDAYESRNKKLNRKQLIVVPENAHADNFIGNFTLNYNAKKKKRIAHWSSPKNFASEDNKDFSSKTKALKEWLLADHNRDVGDVVKESVAVTTYSSFNLVWFNLNEEERIKAATNLSIFIDECHHIKNLRSSEVDSENLVEMTMMAKATKFIIENFEKLNSKVFMFTATNFRGDHCVVLGKEIYEKFTVYQLEFVRHFLTLGIENLDIIHIFYDADPIEQIGQNIENDPNPDAKHYITVPPDCSIWSGNWRLRDRDIKKLKNRAALALVRNKKISMKEAESRINDLVTKNTQSKNKKLLRSEPKFGEPISNSKFDVVITCRLGREGTDWPPCSRIHNASPEKSETFSVQTFGRSLRRFERKDHVVQYYYMKKFIDPSPTMTRAELIADKVHHLLITMLMDENMRPILLPKLTEKSKSQYKSKNKNKNKNSSDYVSMRDIFRYNWEDVKERIVNYFSLKTVTEEKADELIDYIIANYEHENLASEEDIRDGLKLFILKCSNVEVRNKYVSIEFIRKKAQFNKLIEKDETFIYRLEKDDWKILSVLKDDAEALNNDEFSMLCVELPKIKAIELNKDLNELSTKERRGSLREFYEFRDAIKTILDKSKKCTIASIAKSLGVSQNIIEKRIQLYNKAFEKMGKKTFSINESLKNKAA